MSASGALKLASRTTGLPLESFINGRAANTSVFFQVANLVPNILSYLVA